MRILILSPRLDTTFKNTGPVPNERGPIPPIRQHWLYCATAIVCEHARRGDDVNIIEKPLWQFKPEDIDQDLYDLIYVPHRESHNFPIKNGKARYYMQTVFPDLFYIDPKGFAGGASFYPMSGYKKDDGSFDILQQRILRGETKFEQPKEDVCNFDIDYVLFTCQIPHDDTIKYHSDVSVTEALERTLKACPARTVVVRGHPVNPASMEPLKELCYKYPNAVWFNKCNIHSAIKHAKVVVTVNSGTGMEALLHKKPVITFGRCEYDIVTHHGNTDKLAYFLREPNFAEMLTKEFFAEWMGLIYNTTDQNSFEKLS